MKIRKEKKNGQGCIFKDILIEIRDSILFELVWNLLMFIPRMMIRLIKNIFNEQPKEFPFLKRVKR
jgi:hypothetical protein